jgi:hypothetical protein
MDETTERVFETRCDPDGLVVFRRSDGTTIWEGESEESSSKHISQLVKYNYSSVATPPPNTGQIRTNSAVVADTTLVWIHRQDADNRDVKYLFMSQAKQGSELYVQDINDSGSYAMLTLTQPPNDNGDYITLEVELEHESGVPLAGSGILLGVLI